MNWEAENIIQIYTRKVAEKNAEIERLRELLLNVIRRFDEWNMIHPQSDSEIISNSWIDLEKALIEARKAVLP